MTNITTAASIASIVALPLQHIQVMARYTSVGASWMEYQALCMTTTENHVADGNIQQFLTRRISNVRILRTDNEI